MANAVQIVAHPLSWILAQVLLKRMHDEALIAALRHALQIRIGGCADHGDIALIIEQRGCLLDHQMIGDAALGVQVAEHRNRALGAQADVRRCAPDEQGERDRIQP